MTHNFFIIIHPHEFSHYRRNTLITDAMEFKLPLQSGSSSSASESGKMTQSPATPSSPANYDFLMRRASAVYEAQFEVHTSLALACTVVYGFEGSKDPASTELAPLQGEEGRPRQTRGGRGWPARLALSKVVSKIAQALYVKVGLRVRHSHAKEVAAVQASSSTDFL